MKGKRKLALAMALSMILSSALALGACGGESSTGSTGGSSTSTASSSVSSSTSVEDSSSATPVKTKPTAAEVVAARQKANEETEQGYDFTLKLAGNLSAMGLGGAVDGTYNGQYRFNSETNELQFKRQTSGLLLNDSTAYVVSQGVQKMKITVDGGKVKKASVITDDDEGDTFINKPFVALVDSLQAGEITSVKELTGGAYAYEAALTFSAENPYLAKVLGLVGKLGSTISLKGVEFDNPISGLKMQFNIDEDGRLIDFALSTEVVIPVSVADITLSIAYEQSAASSEVTIPSSAGIILDTAEIATHVNAVNAALADIKDDEDYSLDLLAENEFDAGWNKLAVKDSYKARMYKNTTDDGVWFNHSYEYKAHHEEDGAETYKYTIGNISADNSVHMVSRKGSNVVTAAEGITLDTQFAYLTAAVTQTANNFECIKKEQKDGSTFYYMYLNKAATLATQDVILDLINSNNADGVVDVNNYFDTEHYTVNDAALIVEMKNGKLKNITCETELSYTPIGGEYTDYQVTLNNVIKLSVNENLDKASEYEAPGKADGVFGSLSTAGKYIL